MFDVESFAGHAWTIVPAVAHRFAPRLAPAAVDWSALVEDPYSGRISLSGKLRELPGADRCLVVVHGLGGASDAHYCIEAARAAERAGLSCLRLNLRGSGGDGQDFYHGGLTADLSAALASPALGRYERLYVLGYSLGGHITLRSGLDETLEASRVRAIAAVCAPLDLDLSARAIDRTRSLIYRYHVLAGLKRNYAAVARRCPVPTAASLVQAARTLREWDSLTVVPRYGFGSVDNYYASMSVGPQLSRLAVPALLVQADRDPMVPPWTYEHHLQRSHPRLVVHRLKQGGHVGFPARFSLAEDPAARLEEHVLRWLIKH
jgi:predicted alpha/beta-fold hydrolase